MIATRNESTGILTLDVEGSPSFKEIVAGIGWADKTGHETFARNWCVVIGLHEDNTYTSIAEGATPDIANLGVQLTDLKDQLLITRIFTDESQPASVRTLRDPWQTDGLCGYASHGKSLITRRPNYVHEPDFWDHFRNRSVIASLISLPADLQYGYSLLISLLERNIFWTRTTTPRTEWVLNFEPPLEDIFRHPLFQALSHCITFLEREKRSRQSTHQSIPQPRYGNKRKR